MEEPLTNERGVFHGRGPGPGERTANRVLHRLRTAHRELTAAAEMWESEGGEPGQLIAELNRITHHLFELEVRMTAVSALGLEALANEARSVLGWQA